MQNHIKLQCLALTRITNAQVWHAQFKYTHFCLAHVKNASAGTGSYSFQEVSNYYFLQAKFTQIVYYLSF